MRVLVVEDQAELADDIADGLRDQGIGADVAYDGSAAIEKALLNPYDVVVLDRDLPRIHGDAVCATLVGSPSQARILMLTAAGTVDDRVDGLNLGADDYLGKPFAFEELVARVLALARRAPAAAPVIVRGDIVLDRARRRVSRGGPRCGCCCPGRGGGSRGRLVIGGPGAGQRARGQPVRDRAGHPGGPAADPAAG